VDLFLKDLFRGFVLCKQKSQITRFVSIRKDLYTNPASLVKIKKLPEVSRSQYFAISKQSLKSDYDYRRFGDRLG